MTNLIRRRGQIPGFRTRSDHIPGFTTARPDPRLHHSARPSDKSAHLGDQIPGFTTARRATKSPASELGATKSPASELGKLRELSRPEPRFHDSARPSDKSAHLGDQIPGFTTARCATKSPASTQRAVVKPGIWAFEAGDLVPTRNEQTHKFTLWGIRRWMGNVVALPRARRAPACARSRTAWRPYCQQCGAPVMEGVDGVNTLLDPPEDTALASDAGRAAHNRRLAERCGFPNIPRLGSVTVPAFRAVFDPGASRQVASYLDAHWLDGALPLYDCNGRMKGKLQGYGTYSNVQGQHIVELQQASTLLASGQREVTLAMNYLSGFASLLFLASAECAQWYRTTLEPQSNTLCPL